MDEFNNSLSIEEQTNTICTFLEKNNWKIHRRSTHCGRAYILSNPNESDAYLDEEDGSLVDEGMIPFFMQNDLIDYGMPCAPSDDDLDAAVNLFK